MNRRTSGAAERLGGTRDGGLERVDGESVEEFVREYEWGFGET